mmetsp:Transcript_33811/g.88819  ORF Transcript_33811/g.88819 Transcript_33811/m.88819 type:complete len:106 (-) Transcript_33811:593-910(-)
MTKSCQAALGPSENPALRWSNRYGVVGEPVRYGRDRKKDPRKYKKREAFFSRGVVQWVVVTGPIDDGGVEDRKDNHGGKAGALEKQYNLHFVKADEDLVQPDRGS